jgi:alanine dehydrogenase
MAKQQRSDFYQLAREAVTQPQESMVEVPEGNKSISIGVPKEVSYQENRIGLTPQAVNLLVNNGHEVTVETKAGEEAKFTDSQFSEAGAQIAYDRRKVYQSDIIIKVAFPTDEEIDFMKTGQTLISALHLPLLKRSQVKQLMDKKITALAFEFLRDDFDLYPVVQSMSEIAGSAAILIGAEYLTNFTHGKGVMLGGTSGVPPSDVVIIGAGTVGQNAAKAALGLGAQVKVFDNSLFKLRRMKNSQMGNVYTSINHPDVLTDALKQADIAIGAVRAEEGRAPLVVTEEMVSQMKPGSIVVDLSVDHGGSFETSEVTNHLDPIFMKYDVIHYCVPNVPSRVARTASDALSNIFAPILLQIGESGGIKNYLWEKVGVRHGVYVYKGNLTHRVLGERFNIPSKDVDLLIAAHV